MTLENEIRKEFCPNCEADTPCTHEAELYVCEICGEDFAKYIVLRNCNVSDVSMTRDVSIDIKTPSSIENTNPDYYKQEIARRDEIIKQQGEVSVIFQEQLSRRDETIRRLKEDAERLVGHAVWVGKFLGMKDCIFCGKRAKGKNEIEHTFLCPITLHRALMKELE